MPLTSTVESLSRLPLHEGRMADAALGSCHIEARPHFAMPPKKAARFPRSSRLLRHADFERVYKQGRRHFSASFTVFYWPRPKVDREPSLRAGAPAPHSLRVGFTVGRALGGAVQRNRMKRRLREAVRMSFPPADVEADVVINPKKSLLTNDFAGVVKEVSRAFVVIEQKLSKKVVPETVANRRAEARSPEAESRS